MGAPPPSEPQGFDALYGLELTDCRPELARGRVAVREELKQADGFVHEGVYAALAGALCCRGTAASVAEEGQAAIGLAQQITVLHPITQGALQATATRRHRGRTTWVWEVEISDADGRVCVTGRVTVAVRDREDG
jgi:1,4-dihydroxy-2-naphthoyl-CoA hydrolase